MAKFKGFPENMRELMLFHEGDFVLKNVSVNIIDQYKRSKMYKSNMYKVEELTKIMNSSSNSKKVQKEANMKIGSLLQSWNDATSINYKIGSLPPKRGSIVTRIKLEDDQNEIYWIATIYAENGTFSQKMKFINIKGDMSQAVEVRDSEGNLLKEMTSDDFPKNDDGTVKWND
jgi:hypothetical protein